MDKLKDIEFDELYDEEDPEEDPEEFEEQEDERKRPAYAYYQVKENPDEQQKPGSTKAGRKRKTAGNKSFGRRAAGAVALAVIFGLVASAVFKASNWVIDEHLAGTSGRISSVSEEKSGRVIGNTSVLAKTQNQAEAISVSTRSSGSGMPETSAADSLNSSAEGDASIVQPGSMSDDSAAAAGDLSDKGPVAQVAAVAMPCVVAITTVSIQQIRDYFGYRTGQYKSEGSGSGIIVGENDEELLIATNKHVVSGASTVSVCFMGDDVMSAKEETEQMAMDYYQDVNIENAVNASIKGMDEDNDLAVVAVKKSDIPERTMQYIKIATLGDSDDLVVGEQVVAIGNALGYGQSVTSGWVSALGRTVTTSDGSATGLIQTDAAINPGNSGGALLNMQGKLIGINSAKYASSTVEGMGYAIPISKALPILEELMARKTREKVTDSSLAAYLGITVADLSREAIWMYELPQGAFVISTVPGEAADLSGIRRGDIIVEMDGQKITGKSEFLERLQYYEAGEEVKMVLYRSNGYMYEKTETTVTFGSRN